MVDLGVARWSEWVAPTPLRSIEIISDLHLAPQTPRTLSAWLRYLEQTRADAVFILGDLFDSWVGDDSRVSEFEALCIGALERASVRTHLAFMIGNRDFLLGRDALEACHMESLHDPTVLVAFGQRYLLTHGDALCLADTEYQSFRTMVRNPKWQSELLTRPLEERRELARELRAGSIERQTQRPGDEEVDIDTPTALQWLLRANSKTLIHGHTHRPGTDSPAAGYVRHVLSDWSLDDDGLARGEVLRIDATGVQRIPWI